MQSKTRKIFSLLMNCFILLITVVSVWRNYFYVDFASGEILGSGTFRYFTVLSNMMAALAGLFVIIATLRGKFSYWILMFKYLATTAVTVTLMTVLCFLLPLTSVEAMYSGPNLFMHLLTPLAAILSFVWLDGEGIVQKRHIVAGVLPTALYAAVYLTEVVFLQYWPDFYTFNAGGRWYISLPIMLLATLLFAAVLAWLRKCLCKNSVRPNA